VDFVQWVAAILVVLLIVQLFRAAIQEDKDFALTALGTLTVFIPLFRVLNLW